MKCCEYGPKGYIRKFSFSLYFMNGPNEIECLITLSWKGQARTIIKVIEPIHMQ